MGPLGRIVGLFSAFILNQPFKMTHGKIVLFFLLRRDAAASPSYLCESSFAGKVPGCHDPEPRVRQAGITPDCKLELFFDTELQTYSAVGLFLSA